MRGETRHGVRAYVTKERLMSTELLLRYGASRLRVAVQHAQRRPMKASRTPCRLFLL